MLKYATNEQIDFYKNVGEVKTYAYWVIYR